MPLRVVLFGQAPLAVSVLERLLIAGHVITAVYAPPDVSADRPDPLKLASVSKGLLCIQRKFFKKKTGEIIEKALEEYSSTSADINVLASCTSFLPKEITETPKHKTIIFHPSLLPKYRGGNALQWQIINGEKETGVTVFVADDGVDSGPIVIQRIHPDGISDSETTGTLFFKKLCPLGVDAVVDAVNMFDAGSVAPMIQDESVASFQGLVSETDAKINVNSHVDIVSRVTRGCDPQPGAFITYDNGSKKLYLFDSAHSTECLSDSAPGCLVRVDDNGGMIISFVGGCLRFGRVKGDKSKESAKDWIVRNEISIGHMFV